MNDQDKSDTAQVLWFDVAIVLIIAVIAVVSNAHAYFGHMLHRGH